MSNGEDSPVVQIADEVTSIRNQIWNLVDEIPMLQSQFRSFEVVKSRLWDVQRELRKINKEGEYELHDSFKR